MTEIFVRQNETLREPGVFWY